MKKIWTIITLTIIVITTAFAKRPASISAVYVGEKMWNTRNMVPYYQSVSLAVHDTTAYLTYHKGSPVERTDTFTYHDIYNDSYRFVRKTKMQTWNFILLSKDSLHLQVGEPMEENYFYKLKPVIHSVTCPKCNGTGRTTCTRCHGTGYVKVKKAAEPDALAGVCYRCGGDGRLPMPCRHCKGTGSIAVTHDCQTEIPEHNH